MATTNGDKKLDLVYSFDPPNIVYVTADKAYPIQNQLQLNITHPGKHPLAGVRFQSVKTPSSRVEFENPKGLTPADKLPSIDDHHLGFRFDRINVHFLWGDDTNELCTPEEATGIRLNAGPNAGDWYASKRQTDPSIGSYWILFPKTKAVLQGREHIAFLLENIISTAKPGAPLLYVRAVVDGYESPTITPTETYTKLPPLSIRSFTVEPDAPINQGESVKLYWQTWDAENCKLNNAEDKLPTNVLTSSNGHGVQPRLNRSTYTLVAHSNDDESPPKTQTISFNPPSIKLKIAADPVLPGRRLSFALSWALQNVSGFEISANDGLGGRERTLPIPHGATSFQVFPTQLQTRYTMTISDEDSERLDDAQTATQQATATIVQMTPVGSIIAYYGDYPSALPPGWLACNGGTFTQAQYPELYKFLGSDKLPDLGGQFLRGLDTTGKIDPDGTKRIVGNVQSDAFRSHSHHTNIRNQWGSGDVYGFAAGEHSAWYAQPTDYVGGKETRPTNVAVNYIIFAGLPKS